MKTLSLIIISLASAVGMAHGPIPMQASRAIEKSTEAFVATQSKEVQRQFSSVIATKTGHEQFEVVISLINQSAQFKYSCVEDESVEPAVWECHTN